MRIIGLNTLMLIKLKELEDYVDIKYPTIKKCLDYLNIKPSKIIYRCQYPTLLYDESCINVLQEFLSEHPNTRSFFCKLNNRSNDKDVIDKIVYTRKHNSKEKKEHFRNAYNKTYIENNIQESNNKYRQDRIRKNCPSGYNPLCDILGYDNIKSINKTNMIKQICRYLDIKLINVNNNLYIGNNDIKQIEKYLRVHYNKSGRYLGESLVNWLLTKNHIKFEYQKFFDKCRNPKTNRILPFDFYLTDYNCCIEIDGNVHVDSKKQQEHDKIKSNFCKGHKIKLIRIKWGYGKYHTKQYLINRLSKELNKKLGINI